jgi:hypothetical protein
MNVLQALRWATEAWQDEVTEVTIANCWLKSRVLAGQMMPPTKWQAEQMGWLEAVEQDKINYENIVNIARKTIQELKKRQFIKEGQHVTIYLNPPDEIIEHDLDNDDLLKQIAESYARGSESDPDGPEVCQPESISVSQALDAVTTLRGFAEQQKEDYRGFLQQLRSLERDMKALQMANRTQSTLDRFFIAE